MSVKEAAPRRSPWHMRGIVTGAVILLGLAVDGLTGALMLLGLGALLMGLLALVTGRSVLSLPGRKGGARAVVASFVLLGCGAATIPAASGEPETAASSAVAPSPSSKMAEATADASATPPSSSVPSQTPVPEATTAPEPAVEAAPLGSALAAVGRLEVKGRAPKTGYDRDLFAYREVDLDRNGCDVRNDVLRRDLTDVSIRPGTNGCVVDAGVLADPYSGAAITFVRGVDTSSDVQIDHVVPVIPEQHVLGKCCAASGADQ